MTVPDRSIIEVGAITPNAWPQTTVRAVPDRRVVQLDVGDRTTLAQYDEQEARRLARLLEIGADHVGSTIPVELTKAEAEALLDSTSWVEHESDQRVEAARDRAAAKLRAILP